MRVYMDNGATTRVTEPVLEAMLPYFSKICGNPSSTHGFGRAAKRALEAARAQAAKALGAQPREVYFTAGGTEADNWAVFGAARANPEGRRHIITSSIEHHAVLNACRRLDAEGFEVTYLPVDRYGLVDPASLEAALRPDTALVSVMLVNNEVGTVEPVAALAALAHARGALFHTDAVQAVGHMAVDVNALGVDLLSLSGHKLHAPKGVGALYVRQGTRLNRLMEGGEQERGMRPGTENLAGIVGLGAAMELYCADVEARAEGVRTLRDHMIGRILGEIPGARLNGHTALRACGNVNVAFEGIDGAALLPRLDMAGVAASAGPACAAGAAEPSHVLTAMGLSPELARSAVRLTLSFENTREEADYAVDALKDTVLRLWRP